jgi:hypothetical protein
MRMCRQGTNSFTKQQIHGTCCLTLSQRLYDSAVKLVVVNPSGVSTSYCSNAQLRIAVFALTPECSGQ